MRLSTAKPLLILAPPLSHSTTMGLASFITRLGKHRRLWATAKNLQRSLREITIDGGRPGRKTKAALNGTWFGHPLHPVMTDIAVGGYTAAWFLDILAELTDNDRLRTSADDAIAVGLLGSAVSAITGIADWSDTQDDARTIGLIHAATNITGTSIYLASYLNRHTNRSARFWLSMLGTVVLTGGAYLGGWMIYRQGVGVDTAPINALGRAPSRFRGSRPDNPRPLSEERH